MNLFTQEELIDAIEQDESQNNYKTAAVFLLNAMTDWPTLDLTKTEILLQALRKDVKSPLTYDNINGYLKTLTPEFDAWKIEAISSVLEMFDFDRSGNPDKKIELEAIIIRIAEYYKQ